MNSGLGRQSRRANQGGRKDQFCFHNFHCLIVWFTAGGDPLAVIDHYRARGEILRKNWIKPET